MTASPIAIVGRGCVLPGALDPDTFWANIVGGRCSLVPVPDGHWSQPRAQILGDGPDRTWSDVAGVVSGFGRSPLDPVFDWTLHTAQAALREAGRDGPQPRAGLIMGNLSYPTRAFLRYCEHVHLETPDVDARNRFCSGYPAIHAARELGLGGRAFALDAACASTLYAVKLGCDRLRDGSADLMLAGGVSAVDMTFLHIGFATLGALSRAGLSRPFHRDADGLVPGEGAVCFALMRLSDALAEHAPVYGVIRGIGLSNDGRAGGILSPAPAPQVAAMRSAYAEAELDPRAVSLVECHAAGTPAGDATEVASMAEVFRDSGDVPVGSVKSNVGHLLTAAGGAGLLKVLGALEAGVRPMTLGASEPRDEFTGTPLRPLQQNEPWPDRRRAAVSAFGFGGCNAHLIVESFEPNSTMRWVATPRTRDQVAVVAAHAQVANVDLESALLVGRSDRSVRSKIRVELAGLRFPPADLPELLAQQSLLLQVARDAVAGLALPADRTMILVGMGCDPEVARFHLRWQGYDGMTPELTAVRTIGRMPNIVANRLNVQFDVTGPSFAVSAEEASGVVAFLLADRALRAGEAHAAVVGAVDLSHERVHRTALLGLGIDRPSGDAAVVLVLKRLADARRDGDPILAVVDEDAVGEPDLTVGDTPGATLDPTEWFGSPHAASGLLGVATAVLALQHRVVPRLGRLAEERRGIRTAEALVTALGAKATRIRLRIGDPGLPPRSMPTPSRFVDLPGHPTPVSEILAGRHPSQPGPGLQDRDAMPRAPQLAPATHGGRSRLDGPTSVPRASPPPAAPPREPPPQGPSPDHRPAANPVAPARAGCLQTIVSSVADVHRDFLARQTEVHRQFLQLHARVQATLLRRSPPGSERPAPLEAPVTPAGEKPPERPRFDREQLLIHSRGVISQLFGPQFAAQDDLRRQTRLPEPPLLLVDRVIAIDAVPASMGTGTIRTQTDVRLDGWYLDPCGRMSAGPVVEAGQADLMLISWLGADLVNNDERVYRLLGCRVTFHGGLPRPGDTLDYTIGIDGHQDHNGVRLFSFHSDCSVAGEPKLTVRDGQAGYFTDAELAATSGVIWDPATEPARDDGPVDSPPLLGGGRHFDAAAVLAFASGRPAECFGEQWRATWAHVRTPRIGSGRLRLLGEVSELDPGGGPWGRGYLCASYAVTPDDWFFAGHFHNDPCMPGTLMLEASLQAMAFYVASVGCTIDRDGWRFEPAPDEPVVLRCRGQVTPSSKLLTYEVFVSGFSAGPTPTLYADVLCTVDGVKAFHARRLGLRLVPDAPLDHWKALGPPAVQRTGDLVPLRSLGGLVGHVEDPRAVAVDGFQFGYRAMLAAAWGGLADVVGESLAAELDQTRRYPRLPGPPYLFISRITEADWSREEVRSDASLTVEYDVPREAWFFDAGVSPSMPIAALVEVALQPCGVLAARLPGFAAGPDEVVYRNLDGDFQFVGHVQPGARALSTRVELRSSSRFAGSVLQSFAIECRADGVPVTTGTASFGFFPQAALAAQVGLPTSDSDRAQLIAPSEVMVQLRDRPARHFGGPLRLPGPMLLMLDRITGFWPDGGAAGLGRLRAERDIDPADWYFKAHFFGDPVQPGSLGLDAVCQLLQFFCIETGVGARIRNPMFEPMLLGRAAWKFRGQVLPTDGVVTIEAEILEVGPDFVRAEAWLWVDGLRIYHVRELGIRVVSGEDTTPAIVEHILDPAHDSWLGDHRPGWLVPTVPMMSTVDLLVGAASQLTGQDAVAVTDVQLRRWLPVVSPTRLRTNAKRAGNTVAVSLQAWRDAGVLSRFEQVATATVHVGPRPTLPEPFPPLTDAEPYPDVYESGEMFHGPAFHYLTQLRMGSTGSTGLLDAGGGSVPRGHLHQGVLDGIIHVVPHTTLWQWDDEVPRDHIAVPHRIPTLRFFEPLPDEGELRVEARFAGYDGVGKHLPVIDLQVYRDDRLLLAMRLVEILVSIGPLAQLTPRQRRAFLRDHAFVEGLSLGLADGDATLLMADDLVRLAAVPGWLVAAFGLPEGARFTDDMTRVAVISHVCRKRQIHPFRVVLAPDLRSAWDLDRPEDILHVTVTENQGRFRVVDT